MQSCYHRYHSYHDAPLSVLTDKGGKEEEEKVEERVMEKVEVEKVEERGLGKAEVYLITDII